MKKNEGFTFSKLPAGSACMNAMPAGKKAFTLAEVLITLTIIGVVSALTIPTLVQKTNKQEYVSALQKAYSTLSQATQMIIAEEGSPKGSDSWLQSHDTLYDMYKKYLISAKECGSGNVCFEQGNIQNLTGTGNTYNWGTYAGGRFRKLVLADGVQAAFEYNTNVCDSYLISKPDPGEQHKRCASIWVDVNGVKKPNKMGRDVFMFVLDENGLYPLLCGNDEVYCSTSSKNGWTGYGCACKVLREGRMDY